MLVWSVCCFHDSVQSSSCTTYRKCLWESKMAVKTPKSGMHFVDYHATKGNIVVLTSVFSFLAKLHSVIFVWQWTMSETSCISIESFLMLRTVLFYVKILLSTKTLRLLQNMNMQNLCMAYHHTIWEIC